MIGVKRLAQVPDKKRKSVFVMSSQSVSINYYVVNRAKVREFAGFLDFSQAFNDDRRVGIAGAGEKNIKIFRAENIGQGFRGGSVKIHF